MTVYLCTEFPAIIQHLFIYYFVTFYYCLQLMCTKIVMRIKVRVLVLTNQDFDIDKLYSPVGNIEIIHM